MPLLSYEALLHALHRANRNPYQKGGPLRILALSH